jgi:hypothetical protein
MIIGSEGKGKLWKKRGKLIAYVRDKGKEETAQEMIQKKLFSVEFQCTSCTSLLLILS